MYAARHIAERLDKPALASASTLLVASCLSQSRRKSRTIREWTHNTTGPSRGISLFSFFLDTGAYPNILEPIQLNSKSSKASALKQLNPFRRFFQTDF